MIFNNQLLSQYCQCELSRVQIIVGRSHHLTGNTSLLSSNQTYNVAISDTASSVSIHIMIMSLFIKSIGIPPKKFYKKIIDIGMSKEVKSNGTMHIGISCVRMKGVGISCVEHIKTILPSLYSLHVYIAINQ